MSEASDADRLGAELGAISIEPVEIEYRADGAVLIGLVPFTYRSLEGALEFHVLVAPSDTTVVLAAELHDADPLVLEQRAEEFGIEWEIDDDEERDVITLLLGRELRPGDSVDLAEACVRLVGDLGSLLEVGAVQIVDIRQVDDCYEEDFDALGPLKRVDPRAAAELLDQLAERAYDFGARSLAAELRMARAELLNDLGETPEALALADREWSLLGEPVHRTDLVASYAGVLARAGQPERAIDLTRTCLRITDDREGRAALLGNMGSLLHGVGRGDEAVEWLTAAVDDPFVSDEDRATHEANLAFIRGSRAKTTGSTVVRPADFLVDIDRWIDGVAARLLEVSVPAEFLVMIDEIRPQLRRHLAEWERLGPSQRVRLLLMEAQFEARLGGERVVDLINEAAAIAISGGSRFLIESAEEVARLLGVHGVADASHRPGTWENLAITSNRVHAEVSSLMERATPRHGAVWLRQLVQAIDAANDDIRRYSDNRARDHLRLVSRRSYELAIGVAHLAESPADVLDMLERFRDQGAPRPDQREVEDELDRLVADHMRRAATALTVSDPARVRTAPSAADEVGMAAAAAAVAGGPAWWWSAHLVESRLHWGLRAPDGQCWAGLVEHAPAVSRCTQHTTQLEVSHEPVPSDDQLDLAAIASELIPGPLSAALARAARSGTPIRIACAFSSDLATVPLVLLPLPSGARVIDGAIVAKAPPPWVHAISAGRSVMRATGGVTIALGGDPRIGDVPGLGDPGGPDREPRLLGGPAQIRSGRCSELASPMNVSRAWSLDHTDIAVFYGHIVAGTASAPLGGGLELCDERGRPSRWTVAAMLAAERGGLAPVAVLAGCSSMGLRSHIATEWWGPACGLLWRGANHVIGTQWEVKHGSKNVRFVSDLIRSVLHRPGDVPAALQAVQLSWSRSVPDDPSARSGLPVWSAYGVVGATPVS